jgi:hypothetical protein
MVRSDWIINGHDYGHNFTLNICEPLLSDYSDVVDVQDRTNVSAYYVDTHGSKISIGYIFAPQYSYPVSRHTPPSLVDGDYCWSTKTALNVRVTSIAAHSSPSSATGTSSPLYPHPLTF